VNERTRLSDAVPGLSGTQFLSGAEKQAMVEAETRFDVLAVTEEADRFGPRWVLRIRDGLECEYLLTLSAHPVRDRLMHQLKAARFPVGPCTLRLVPTASGNTTYTLADGAEEAGT
jgi:hypothetical protein